MKWKAFCSLFVLTLVSAGCAVGPNYKRPEVPVPATHRSESAFPAMPAAGGPQTLADVKWFELFRDEKLQQLIRRGTRNQLRRQDRSPEGAGGPGTRDCRAGAFVPVFERARHRRFPARCTTRA